MAALTQAPAPMDRPLEAIALPEGPQRMLLFFGYVDCPRICPVTMSVLKDAHAAYAARGAGPRLGVTFVNLTPADPGVAEAYARHFHPEFTGLQASPADRRALMRELGVRFERRRDDPAGWHTDAVYVLARDADGWRLRTIVRDRPLDAERLARLAEEL